MFNSTMAICGLLLALRIFQVFGFAEELLQVTDELTQRYLDVFRCITYITDTADAPIPTTSSHRRQMIVVRLSSNGTHSELIQNGYEQFCSGFVIRVAASTRRMIIADMIRAYKKAIIGRYNDKRYLFLPEDDDDDETDFLDDRDMYYMPNLVFAVWSAHERGFRIFGHNYFDGYKYDVLRTRHEVLDTWRPSTGFERNVNLYPNKIINLRGKTVKFSTLHYRPYTLVIQEGDKIVFDGLETRIAAQFVESNNGSWIGEDNPIHLWGDLFNNETGTGVFGSVYEHKADMGFSGIYQWYCNIFECSYPYIRAEVTCLAPKPEAVSGWLTIIFPFQPSTWIALITSYIISVLIVFSFNIVSNNITGEKSGSYTTLLIDSFFNAFRLQLEQIPSVAYKKTAMAYFFKMWTVYCFFVAACWQGGIASFLTVPRYEDPINTAQDLVSRFPKLHWGANHDVWIKSIEGATDPITSKIVREFVVSDDYSLKARVPKKDFAYFVERLPNGHFGLNDYIDREGMKYMRIMEKNLYFGYCVIISTRGSPYQERLDRILLRMIETGIILKMEVQVSLQLIDNQLQNLVRASLEKPSDVVTNLRSTHILGAIMLFLLGSVFSTATFLLELRLFKCKKEL